VCRNLAKDLCPDLSIPWLEDFHGKTRVDAGFIVTEWSRYFKKTVGFVAWLN